jgi:hypothetical protein
MAKRSEFTAGQYLAGLKDVCSTEQYQANNLEELKKNFRKIFL